MEESVLRDKLGIIQETNNFEIEDTPRGTQFELKLHEFLGNISETTDYANKINRRLTVRT